MLAHNTPTQFSDYVKANVLDLKDFEFKNVSEVRKLFLFLNQHPEINTLRFGYISITDGSEEIHKRFDSFAYRLKENKTLTTLDMSGNNLGDEHIYKLASVLKVNTTLTALDISHIYMTNKGFLVLMNALKNNHTLLTLAMSGNIFQNYVSQDDYGYGEDYITVFSEMLKMNKGLQTLYIDHGAFFQYLTFDSYRKHIADRSIEKLTEAFTQNTTLTHLVCYKGNQYDKMDPEVLIKVLKNNTGIVQLDGITHPILDEYLKRNQATQNQLKQSSSSAQGLFSQSGKQEIDQQQYYIRMIYPSTP